MNIYIVILGLLTLSFAVAYLSALYRLAQIHNNFSDIVLSQDDIRLKYEQYLALVEVQNEDNTHKEEYIKFLSDSREDAFNYIEEVQLALLKFLNEVNPQIEYYNKYGIVVDGMVPPHDFALKKISKEIEELKKFLPSNDKNI